MHKVKVKRYRSNLIIKLEITNIDEELLIT
jgi:hypothetical protein